MPAVDLLIAALATFRLTRLLTADQIAEPLREWAELRAPWAGYLTTCAWCSSVWLAGPVALAALLAPESLLVRVPLLALALSAAAGLISERSGN